MSQKRKIEEYHDPDYPVDTSAKKPHLDVPAEEKLKKIRSIIKREFQMELAAKEQEITKIDTRINLTRQLLHRVRYAVVVNYYNSKAVKIEENEKQTTDTSLHDTSKGIQEPIHPGLKSILGKKPVNYYEILKNRPTREASKNAKNSIAEKLRTKKEEKKLIQDTSKKAADDDVSDNFEKIPRYVDPLKTERNIPQLNTARGRNQTKHLIVVGNTSKFIGDESTRDEVTHKWLVYVKTKSPVPVEQLITKVRFFLHPSYKPNDLVDVCSPPFQLSRRGWGEFPIRLQLFFDSRLQQKPVQLVHNLILDKTLSGLQTMGAETLVEIWLCCDHLSKQDHNAEGNGEMDLEPVKTIESEDIPVIASDESLSKWLNNLDHDTEGSVKSIKQINETIANGSLEIDNNEYLKENELLSEIISSSKNNGTKDNLQKQENTEFQEKGNQSETENIKVPNSTIVSTLCNSVEQANVQCQVGSPKIFKKKIVKCIGKDGKVKLVEMFVNQKKNEIQNNSNSRKDMENISKLNGQLSNDQKPILMKVVSPNSITLGGLGVVKNAISNTTLRKIILVNKKGITNNDNEISKQISSKFINKIIGSVNTDPIENNVNVKKIELVQPHITSSQGNNFVRKLENMETCSLVPKIHPNCTKLDKINSDNLSKNQIILKNGKMYIIDPLQIKLKQQIKKQESLLKPQISLLKPIVKNDNLQNCIRNESRQIFNHTSIATDHDYTSWMGKSSTPNTIKYHRPLSVVAQKSNIINNVQKNSCNSIVTKIRKDFENSEKQNLHSPPLTSQKSIVTVNSPCNNPINIIVTKLETDFKNLETKKLPIITQKSIALMKRARFDYRKELENSFYSIHFSNIRHAIEFLLRKIPLINNLSSDNDYKTSFPFTVSSEEILCKLTLPKRRSNEWILAKCISNLVNEHPSLKDLTKWTTKEIVLFARYHAYTPVIQYMKIDDKTKPSNYNSTSLKDLVKKEIKREQYMHQTLSLNHNVYKWINEIKEKIKGDFISSEEIINVDKLSDADMENFKSNSVEMPTKIMDGKYWLPADTNYENEFSLVSEYSQQLGIRLLPEEIVPGVMHSSAQLVLAHALRSFIEDVLRRSISFEIEVENFSSIETPVRLDNVKKAITSRVQFDFLTNRHFGTAKVKEQVD